MELKEQPTTSSKDTDVEEMLSAQTPKIPNSHNMEPASPSTPPHKRLDLILGTMFAGLAVLFAVGFILVDSSSSSQETPSQEIIALDEQSEGSEENAVESFRSDIALEISNYKADQVILDATQIDDSSVHIRVDDLPLAVNESSFFYVLLTYLDVEGVDSSSQEALQSNELRSQLHSFFELKGLALSAESTEGDLLSTQNAQYENIDIVCDVFEELAGSLSVACYDQAIDTFRALGYYDALQANSLLQVETETAITTLITSTDFEKRGDYDVLEAALGGSEKRNGVIVPMLTGSGRIVFYAPAPGDNWQVFSFGQSTPLCTDFITKAERFVFASEPCNDQSDPSGVQTVQEFYTEELPGQSADAS